jgi:cytosine/adenosine deaminase-related metal-dependent hydrolase
MLVGLRNNFRRDEEVELAFHACTRGGADVMRIAGYGLAVGCAGDMVVVEGEAITHAVVAHPPRKLVVKRGRVVARDGACLRAAP